MNSYNWPWHIENLPFYYAPLTTRSNGGIPDYLPFTLDIEKDIGLLIQRPNLEISNALDMAYRKGSMLSGLMDDSGIGKQYADDFLKFIQAELNDNIQNKKILEIGCGTGYLLRKLQQLGADVVGIEPGQHGQIGAKKYHVPIVQDFFPSPQIKEYFDIIIMYGVLEHISNPKLFLQKVSNYLQDNGKVILAVPDSQPYIDCGDISMLFHEHFNYFTKKTLQNLLMKSTKQSMTIHHASFGGLLYVVTEKTGQTQAMVDDYSAVRYRELAEKYINRLKKYFLEYSKEYIGIYVAGRAINILTLLKDEIDISKLRFFDDNKILHNTYFPGFDNKVESCDDLLRNSPQRIVIMSSTFGEVIKQKLLRVLPPTIPIETLDNLNQRFS